MMRAAVHTTYGPPSVMRIEEVPIPEPRAGQVQIKVHAATMNRTDCGFRSAEPFPVRFFSGLLKPRKPISGTEFAGEISALGANVSGFKIGDKVFGRTKDEQPGTHAEYVCLPAKGAIAPLPEGFGFEDAAAICDGAMLADVTLKKVDFSQPKRVLVNGASGSIGSAGMQLAKAYGAEVTAVAKTEALDRLLELGADHVIDYTKEDFTKLDRTFDVVLDAVGKSTYGLCKPLLKGGGYYFSSELGPYCQNPLLALKTRLFGGKIKVHFPIPAYRKQDAEAFKDLAEAGKYRPLIDRSYPLEDIVAAGDYVETGEKIGNVIIRIRGDESH